MSEQKTQLVKKLRKVQASISPGSELAFDIGECLVLLGEPIDLPKVNPKTAGLIITDAAAIEKGERPSATPGMITTQSLGYGDSPPIPEEDSPF